MKPRSLLSLLTLALLPGSGLFADTFTFTTDQSQITSGTNNQGWWSTNPTALNDRTTNDNYIVGLTTSLNPTQHRDFFTFDLSSLPAGSTTPPSPYRFAPRPITAARPIRSPSGMSRPMPPR